MSASESVSEREHEIAYLAERLLEAMVGTDAVCQSPLGVELLAKAAFGMAEGFIVERDRRRAELEAKYAEPKDGGQ